MRTTVLAAGFVLALILGVARAACAQSGLVEQTCNTRQARHYSDKATSLMRQNSYSAAAWACQAGWDSQAKCPAATRSPLWVFWWNLGAAATYYDLHVYEKTLHYLSQADSWKPFAQAYSTATNQVAAYDADVTLAATIRNAMVAMASRPPIIAAPPRAYYYAAPPAGSGCDEDSIETVGDDGAILVMLSGAVYHVADYDTPTSSLWLATEDVIICGSRIVNKDDDGEAVDGSRVR